MTNIIPFNPALQALRKVVERLDELEREYGDAELTAQQWQRIAAIALTPDESDHEPKT
jgi:hypothetical protein